MRLRRFGFGIGEGLTLLLLVGFAIVIIYPLFWMVVSSMKSYKEIYNNVWGLPSAWLIENYKTAWEKGISAYFVNSVIVTMATVVSVLIIASMAAFALSRFRPRSGRPCHSSPQSG